MAVGRLNVPPSVPRSTVAPSCHRNACVSLAAVVLNPTTCPRWLIARAWLKLPPKVPRSALVILTTLNCGPRTGAGSRGSAHAVRETATNSAPKRASDTDRMGHHPFDGDERREALILRAVEGLLQALDVDLLHLQHRLHGRIRLLGILVAHQFAEDGGNDLPGHAILVLEPTALLVCFARGEFPPQIVHFLLRLTVHEQRDRGCELVLGTAVQRIELLPLELERATHDGAVRARHQAHDLGVLEDRNIELHRLFSLAVEPEKRDDLLHRILSSVGLRLPSPRARRRGGRSLPRRPAPCRT